LSTCLVTFVGVAVTQQLIQLQQFRNPQTVS